MLGTIRKKLNTVIQEGIQLSETLSNNYIKQTVGGPSDETPTNISYIDRISISSINTKNHQPQIPNGRINLNAGCQLIESNERNWQECHQITEENALIAEHCDELIGKLRLKCRSTERSITDLNTCINGLPKLQEMLSLCQTYCEKTCQLCDDIDKKMFELEDLTDQLILQDVEIACQLELSIYKQKKLDELENFRKEIANKHSDKVKQHEEHLRKIQQERQAVFQDAFLTELNKFKEDGTLPAKVDTVRTSELTLEEIILDDNSGTLELDNFLNS